MNNAHLHMVVNHLPIIFPIAGIIVLLIGIFTKSEVTKRNSYFLFIIGAVACIAAMATGEGAEETVENLSGVSESLIKTHEEAAELFAGLSYVLGGASLFALIANFKEFKISNMMQFGVLAISAGSLYFAVEAGRTGGEIRHTEICSGAVIQNGEQGQNGNENASENTQKEKDED